MSVIRVVARITPLIDASSQPLPVNFVPREFGEPITVETSQFTDPRTGLRYVMETAMIAKTYDASSDVVQEVSSECERVPGFVCAQGSCLDPPAVLSPLPDSDGTGFAALSLPHSICRDQVPQLVSPQESLKVKFNLKHQARNRRPSQDPLGPLLRYFIEDECLICGTVAPALDVAAHMRTHIRGGRSYCCTCCSSQRFSSARALYVHMLNKAKEFLYACDICGTRYQRKHLLTVHQLKNHSDAMSPFSPSEDNRSWRQNVPPCYACSGCGERLVTLEEVGLHAGLHGDGTDFQCLFCGRSFRDIADLRDHTHVRVVTKKFPCKMCDEEFPNSKALQVHQKLHVKDPFVCQGCGGKKFYFENTYLKHMRLIHGMG